MKIISYDQAKLDKTAVALGKFQGLHRGHMLLIDKILSLAAEGMTSVVFTINMPSDRTIYLPEERYSILEDKGVDVVVDCPFTDAFASMSPERFVREVLIDKLHASYVVVGKDFKFGYNRQGDIDRLVEFGIKYGFRVIALDKLSVDDRIVSSSYLRTLIESGDMESVSRFMGRDYMVSGYVRHGKQLGRTIGFPTINMIPDCSKLLPVCGVYESYLMMDGRRFKGITNIGDNPTTDTDGAIRIETHILDYTGDLYGKKLELYIRRFIRTEKKFHNVDELKQQIERDKENVMHQ
ncbi:MAG: bifunctional riboflavin kinase/FAD synthetase [Wujia sp.]